MVDTHPPPGPAPEVIERLHTVSTATLTLSALAFTLPPGAYATTVLGEIFSLERFRGSAGEPVTSGE